MKSQYNTIISEILNLNEDIVKELIKINKNNNATEIIENYKTYASWVVKFNLLKNAKFTFEKINGKRLKLMLDLASGRGNDLNRWIALNIPKIVGIEVDPEQYNEAIIRLNKKKETRGTKGTKVEYILGSALSMSTIQSALKGMCADIVVCNFAMNYFFKDINTIKSFFSAVSNNMDDGALFVGTCADGDVIKSLLEFCGPIDNYLYTLQKDEDTENGYHIALKTPYFDDGSKIYTEYFIHKHDLVDICAEYDLFPIKIDYYDPICNLKYINSNTADKNYYKFGLSIRVLYFRFSFIKKSKLKSKE